MLRAFFLLLLASSSCRAVGLGQPSVIPQFSTVQGSQIKAADVHVPVAFTENESQELFVLSEGFVCPGQLDRTNCQESPGCVCDYAHISSCSDLPSCCETADPAVFASACSLSSPASWLAIHPEETLNLVAPPVRTSATPVYLRYHPSSAASCRGFGMSVLAPFTEQGTVISVANTVLYYVSWTNAKPETDPNASVLTARPGQSDNMGRPRFCPSYDSDSAQSNGFMGPSNTRTAFIAVFSETSNGSMQNVAAVITMSLFETPDISTISSFAPAFAPALSIADRTTVVVPSGQLSAKFSYTHSGSDCANLVVDAHSNSASSTTSMTADFAPSYVRWQQTGYSAASSLAINICHGETLFFEVSTALATDTATPGATTTLVTAYAAAPVALLSINKVNPNLYGPLLAGARAARMLCDANYLPALAEGPFAPIYTNPEGRAVSACIGSYLNSNTPSCQMYPIVNRYGASHLWPAAPTGILDVTSYSQLNATTLNAVIADVLSNDLRFAVILEQVIFQSPYYGSVAGWVFRSWEELAQCTFEFGGTLVNGDGSRLFGQSAPLGWVQNGNNNCDPNTFSRALDTLETTYASILDPSFGALSIVNQRSGLVQQTQLALRDGFSQCTYVPQEVYLTPYSQTVNCSILDPCCPLTDQFTRYFNNYCTSDVQKKISPQINEDAILAVGGDTDCSIALALETMTSQLLLSTGANAVNNIACSFGQDSLDYLRKELRSYYGGCRTLIAGPFDKGLPCTTVDDCPDHPQMACLPVQPGNLYNPSLSQPFRRQKMCQAPTSVFDDLVLECLLDQMPVLCTVSLSKQFAALGLNGTFATNLKTFGGAAGCSATGPSLLQTYAATNSLQLNNFNPAGQNFNSCSNTGTCPYPVNCVDAFCELSQGCTYPWGCATHWDSFTIAPSQALCNSKFRCNFVAPGEIAPFECTGNAESCLAECAAVLGLQSFCGYCDEASGYCYVATDSGGTPLSQAECEATAADSTCFIQDLGSLVAEECNGLGSCSHFADNSESMSRVTAAACESAPGLCLTQEGSIMFPRVSGCMGGIQILGQGCNGLPAQLTDSGCLYDLSAFPTPQSCIHATDPAASTRVMKGWVDLVDTEEECTGNEALFVCNVAFSSSTPLSGIATLNTKEVCAARGGVFQSPYVWQKPTFIGGTAVPLTWMNVVPVASGTWGQRLNYPKFSAFVTSLINGLQLDLDVLTSECTYTNVLTVSALAAVCQNEEGNSTYDEACSPIFSISDGQAPTQHLGQTIVCDNAEINDWITYPSDFTIPPAVLFMTENSHLKSPSTGAIMPGCATFDADMKSNAKFFYSRRRIRESSFYIVRQDTDIPALSTLSTKVVANGFVLSDAVQVTSPGTKLGETWFCAETRSDFLANIRAQFNNRSDWSSFYLTFGILDDWAVTPIPTASDSITAYFLTADGELLAPIGNRFPEGMALADLLVLCRRFERFELEPERAPFFVAVMTYNEDPEDVSNGFNTAQTVWLYITACVYLAPILFLWLPLVLRSVLSNQSIFSVPMIATFFLSLFLVFRATLLFGLAAGTIVPSSTTEFALTDIAVWCEFAAVSLLGIVITIAMANATKMLANKGFSSSRHQQIFFLFMIIFLLTVYIAFVIAYSQTGDSSSGVTDPRTNCLGRVPVGETVWTTRRILRFSYECLLAAMGLIIGVWLVWISWSISVKTRNSNSVEQLFRLTSSTAVLALMILSHAIIALILIGTEWDNFIFGITMLYVTELIPVFLFFLLSLWKNITEFSSLSFSKPSGATSSGGPSGSGQAKTSSGSARHTTQ